MTSAACALSPRQISFVHNYLECRVRYKAAELAGYSGDMQTLAVTANELLKNPKVQAYYLECLRTMQVTPDETLAEIGAIARSPWREHIDVKVDDDGNTVSAQLKLSDKLKALELAGKAHGLFIERSESINLNVNVGRDDLFALLQQSLEDID
jgi:phage terminase small subunit